MWGHMVHTNLVLMCLQPCLDTWCLQIPIRIQSGVPQAMWGHMVHTSLVFDVPPTMCVHMASIVVCPQPCAENAAHESGL